MSLEQIIHKYATRIVIENSLAYNATQKEKIQRTRIKIMGAIKEVIALI